MVKKKLLVELTFKSAQIEGYNKKLFRYFSSLNVTNSPFIKQC